MTESSSNGNLLDTDEVECRYRNGRVMTSDTAKGMPNASDGENSVYINKTYFQDDNNDEAYPGFYVSFEKHCEKRRNCS